MTRTLFGALIALTVALPAAAEPKGSGDVVIKGKPILQNDSASHDRGRPADIRTRTPRTQANEHSSGDEHEIEYDVAAGV